MHQFYWILCLRMLYPEHLMNRNHELVPDLNGAVHQLYVHF